MTPPAPPAAPYSADRLSTALLSLGGHAAHAAHLAVEHARDEETRRLVLLGVLSAAVDAQNALPLPDSAHIHPYSGADLLVCARLDLDPLEYPEQVEHEALRLLLARAESLAAQLDWRLDDSAPAPFDPSDDDEPDEGPDAMDRHVLRGPAMAARGLVALLTASLARGDRLDLLERGHADPASVWGQTVVEREGLTLAVRKLAAAAGAAETCLGLIENMIEHVETAGEGL